MTQSRRSSATHSDRRSERSGSSCPQGPGTESQSDVTQPELGRGVGFGPYGVSPKQSLSAKDVQRSLGGKDEERCTSSRPSRTEALGEARRLSRKPRPGEDLSDISYLVGAPEREAGAGGAGGPREHSPPFSETSHTFDAEPRQSTDGTTPRKGSAIQSQDARKGTATLPHQLSGAHFHSGAGANDQAQDGIAPTQRKGSAVQSQDSFAARKGTATLPQELSGPHLHSGAGAHDQVPPSALQSGSGRREVVEQPYACMSGAGQRSLHSPGSGKAYMKPGGADAHRRSTAEEPRNARPSVAKPCGGRDQGAEGAPGNSTPPASEEPRASPQQRQSQRTRPSSTAGQRGSQAHQGRQVEEKTEDKQQGVDARVLEDEVTGSTKTDTDNTSGSSRGSRRSGEPARPQPQAMVVSPPSRRSSARAEEGRGQPEEDNTSGSSRSSRRSGESAQPQPQPQPQVAVVSPPSRRSSAQAKEGRGQPEEDAARGGARVSKAQRFSVPQQEAFSPPARRSCAQGREEPAPHWEQQEEEPAFSEATHERVVEEAQQPTDAGSLNSRGSRRSSKEQIEEEGPAARESNDGNRRTSKRGSRASRLEVKDEETEVLSDTGNWRKLSDFVDSRKSPPERLEEETEEQLAEAHGEPSVEECEERKSIKLDRDVKGQVAGLVWTFGRDPERRGAWLKGFKKNAPLPEDHDLAAGDELLAVNGMLVRGLPREEIEEIWLTSQPAAERYLHLEFIAHPVPAV